MVNPIIELIDKRAKENPKDLAFVSELTALDFSSLRVNVRRVAKKLRDSGISKGQTVATALPGRLDWVFTLALMHEGAASCSIETSRSVPAGLDPEWLIALRPVNDFPIGKTLIVTDDWLKRSSNPDESFFANSWNSAEIVRISSTSGTTGEPKLMGYGLEQIEARRIRSESRIAEERIRLNLIGLPSSQAFWRGIECLTLGSPYINIRSSSESIPDAIGRFGIEQITGAPGQLDDIFTNLEKRRLRIPQITEVRIGGSAANDSLIRRIRNFFPNAGIWTSYATSESGLVAGRRLGDGELEYAGRLLPDSEALAFDEQLNPLQPGEIGQIGVKTPLMILEYLNNPEASAKHFKAGWFFPGDLGSVSDSGDILVLGREGDYLEKDSTKIYLGQVDRSINKLPGVIDAASFIYGKQSDLLGVAVRTDPRIFQLERLITTMISFDKSFTTRQVLSVTVVPRTSAGKVDRKRLAESANSILA